ncbi:MAG: Rho termination factor N-terminal domain-containing protein, partial [Spirochaetales bacterium]|nr:Rho termination factor N-terminal domain-containing protein [Spirochaetales bacterium]
MKDENKSEEAMAEIRSEVSDVEAVTRPRRKKIRVELIRETISSKDEEVRSDVSTELTDDSSSGVPESDDNDSKSETSRKVVPKRKSRSRTAQRGRSKPSDNQNKEKLSINDLSRMTVPALRELGEKLDINLETLMTMKKQEVIFAILKAHTQEGGIIYAYGSLEILPDGYGFLRSPQNSYLPGSDDIYMSPSQIRLFILRTGDTVYGQIRPPKEGERFFAMLRVEKVNDDDPLVAQSRVSFESLTPLYAEERFDLET